VKFLKYDLGHLDRGDTVVVKLSGDSVNVRLLDAANFSAYRAGRRHRYQGGHVTRSPHRIVVPNSGRWIVAIDRGGYAVNATASIKVEKKNSRILPAAPSGGSSGIAEIGRNLAAVRSDDDDHPSHDLFISHASEDKSDVARPLHDVLVEHGLSVWLDEVELKVGASLRRGIDRAVAKSRFAVVVLSPSFFLKNWTQYELDGLVAREMNGEQIILPIWHNITKDQILEISPSLADRIALNTATSAISEIAAELAAAVEALCVVEN